MSVERNLLYNICTECGTLYYWCSHHCETIAGTPEEARVALAKTMLAAEFAPHTTSFDSDKHIESVREAGLIE
jgi:hypothetical protein